MEYRSGRIAAEYSAATSAGDLSALGEDADGVVAVEPSSVPAGGGGVAGEVCVVVFKGPGVWGGRVSWGCAEVSTVGADEPELTWTCGEDFELSGVMGDVVAFTQQQEVGQVGAAAVDPVDPVMCVQVLGVRATGVSAMVVLARQQGAVLAVGD